MFFPGRVVFAVLDAKVLVKALFFGYFLPFVLLVQISQAASDLQNTKASTLAFGGKVELQKEGQRSWRPVNKKLTLSDGDILKSGPKSFVVIQEGEENIIVLGSNSRILLNFALYQASDSIEYAVNLTLLEGAVYSKWKTVSILNVFTSNASASSLRGTFNTIYYSGEEKTVFQVLSGEITGGNIAQSSKKDVPKGHVLTVKGESDAATPEGLKKAAAEEMSLFFGTSFVEKEMLATGFDFNEKKNETTDSLQIQERDMEDVIVNSFFSKNNPLIKLEKLKNRKPYYVPPVWSDSLPVNKYHFEIKSGITQALDGNGNKRSYFGFFARSGMHLGKKLRFAVNLPLESGASGFQPNTFTTPGGMADKIHYLDWGRPSDRFYLHLGEIKDLTFNRGLLVYGFSNELKSQIAQPLGMYGNIEWRPGLNLYGFVGDLASPGAALGGGNISYENGLTGVGFSVIGDLNQGGSYTLGDNEFNAPLPPVVASPRLVGFLYGWDAYLEFNVLDHYPFFLNGYAGVAGLNFKYFDNQGLVLQAPGAELIWGRMKFHLEALYTLGRISPGYFNEFYLEDRSRIYYPLDESSPMVISQFERHPDMKGERGFRLGMNWQILNSLWTGFTLGDNRWFANEKYRYTINDGSIQPTRQKSNTGSATNRDRYMAFKIFAGSGLIPRLQRAEFSYEMQHGRLGRMIKYPADSLEILEGERFLTGVVSPSAFLSLSTSIQAMAEYRVLKNASILGEYRAYGLDFNANGIYDANELVSEIQFTWRMTF